MANVQIMQPGRDMTRKDRRPNFPHAGACYPWEIAPVLMHPVLPGETLHSYNSTRKVVSRPVIHPFSGAWCETFLAYVKISDIDEALTDMFLSDSMSTSGYTESADRRHRYSKNGDIAWVDLCSKAVADHYFTDESETPRRYFGDATQNFQAKVNHKSWYQNMAFHDDIANPTLATDPDAAGDQIRMFEMLQQMALTENTYENFIESYGMKLARESRNAPEILRYARSWTLPANHVEPTTGAPTSAWYWSHEMKLDKPKMFREPGFIIELMVLRPKVYTMSERSAVGSMWGLSDWFPAYLMNDPAQNAREIQKSDKLVAHADGAGTGTKGLLYDNSDLLSHGEQFVRHNTNAPYQPPTVQTMDVSDTASVQDLRGEYVQWPLTPFEAFDNLFVGNAGYGDSMFTYDGMASMHLKGHIMDATK